MDENDNLQQQPRIERPLSESELRYYYFGFYKVLKRYRAATFVGWAVVAIGCASIPAGWSVGRAGGVIDIILCCATVVAGLVLVSQNIACLEAYVRIALPSVHNGEESALVHEILGIMTDVDEGGWQEAHAAMRKLMEMGKAYGLPPLQ